MLKYFINHLVKLICKIPAYGVHSACEKLLEKLNYYDVTMGGGSYWAGPTHFLANWLSVSFDLIVNSWL